MNSTGDNPSDPETPPISPTLATEIPTPQRSGFLRWFNRSFNPFRIATLRGLAIVLPPLLTIIFFVWLWSTIDRAILHPVESLARFSVVSMIDDTLENSAVKKLVANSKLGGAQYKIVNDERIFVNSDAQTYAQIKTKWIPTEVVEFVRSHPGEQSLNTAREYYVRYVELRYLQRHLTIPMFLALFLALMYLIGKLLAAGLGRFFYHYFESLIHRVPIIRNVYSSVKQVTDFAFSDNEVQFNRVVALEYPCKGVWSMGFVTGESMIDIRDAAGEPMLSVLMPTSPMPATGFTISVPRSQTIELNITLDQAIQFCVSCGVVVPEHQMAARLESRDKGRELRTESRELRDKS